VRTVPPVRKLVSETGLIVCQYSERRTQYDRLSQQQLSFLFLVFFKESGVEKSSHGTEAIGDGGNGGEKEREGRER